MRPSAGILFTLAFGCVFATKADTTSFSGLAVSTLGSVWPELQPALHNINDTIAPNNTNLHDTRKTILLIRNLVDVFAPVYPNSTKRKEHQAKKGKRVHGATHHEDIWYLIRKDLDDGYTLLGNFQDLAHSNVSYTNKDVIQRRSACLKWIQHFFDDNSTYHYQEFIYFEPRNEGFWYEHQGESSFFWKDVTPPANVSGMDDIKALVKHQLTAVLSSTVTVLELDSIFDTEAHDTFHGYRKQLRAVNDEAKIFKDALFYNTTNVTAALALFGDLYDKFGDLNDEWTAWNYYAQKHDKTKTAAAAAVVTKNWTVVKEFLWNANVPAAVHALVTSMAASPAPPPR